MNMYVMDDERYQPIGVAVYRTSQEVETELRDQGCEDSSEGFWAALRVEDIDATKIPASGVFSTTAEYKAALILDEDSDIELIIERINAGAFGYRVITAGAGWDSKYLWEDRETSLCSPAPTEDIRATAAQLEITA